MKMEGRAELKVFHICGLRCRWRNLQRNDLEFSEWTGVGDAKEKKRRSVNMVNVGPINYIAFSSDGTRITLGALDAKVRGCL